MWVRTGTSIRPDHVRGADLFHLLVAESPEGRVKVACGRTLVGGYEAVNKPPGHWPDAASCHDCVAIARTQRPARLGAGIPDGEGQDTLSSRPR